MNALIERINAFLDETQRHEDALIAGGLDVIHISRSRTLAQSIRAIMDDFVAGGPTRSQGSAMIATERERQITVEGWTADHDDALKSDKRRNQPYELLGAAQAYVYAATAETTLQPLMWPWDAKFWKPADPVRMLVKAGALIAAEIDRRLRRGEA